jgi:IMP cyclohydrolase
MLTDELALRAYPGRVCLVAITPSHGVRFIYALTGRSESSRARSLRVQPSKVEVVDERESADSDPLRHYLAGIRAGSWTVLGNGDHVEPLAEALCQTPTSNVDIERAWLSHTFEPDPPIYTPRIWIAARELPTGRRELWAGAVSRSDSGSPSHRVWSIDGLAVGTGMMLTTYSGPVAIPVPDGDVVPVRIGDDAVIDEVWAALNPALRVSAIEIDVTTGDFTGAALREQNQADRADQQTS